MLATLLFLIAFSSPTFHQDPLVDSPETINYINSVQNQWFSSNKWTQSLTRSQASLYANLKQRPMNFPQKKWGLLDIQIPDSFDSRTYWPGCVHPILNQGQCGSCWAFGATQALSDRFCVQLGENIVLSPQWLLDCDWLSFGCNGGWPDQAWLYMKHFGIPTQQCVGYLAKAGSCPKKCDDGSQIVKYYATNVHLYFGVENIQKGILAGGPVETQFEVYEDFMTYGGGIYKYVTGKYLGGHAVKIIGWGVQDGVKYWICANSWGTDWGLDGLFYIEFDQCGINTQAVAGDAFKASNQVRE